jgi:hypothetical protein
MFSSTLYRCSSRSARDQVSHSHRTVSRIPADLGGGTKFLQCFNVTTGLRWNEMNYSEFWRTYDKLQLQLLLLDFWPLSTSVALTVRQHFGK